MSVLVLLIAAGGLVACGFLIAFAWAVRSGQFDDTASPPLRMLFDDSPRSSVESVSEGAPHVHTRH
jgi:cbb3-type cytochrome oxidase maturation protein